jgi:hypothetical protein
MALFCNVQLIRTLALKGEKCQRGRGYEDRMTVLVCCNADGSEKLCPLIVSKFEKPHCLKGLRHYPCYYKSSKSMWVTGRLFREWLFGFERKMACQKRTVLLQMCCPQ